MRIVCISDTHNCQIDVPEGDVLVHAGDHTMRGTEKEMKRELDFLSSLPHKHKVLIAGNHDFFFDRGAPKRFRSWSLYRYYGIEELLAKHPNLTYLENSDVVIDGVKFYGSPWTPYFWQPDGVPWAFQFAEGEKGRHQATNMWARIPEDTNVLITHGPPAGIRDGDSERAGDPCLRLHIEQLEHLRLHVFGHFHSSYGLTEYEAGEGHRLTFVNAAINTEEYKPLNNPIVVDI